LEEQPIEDNKSEEENTMKSRWSNGRSSLSLVLGVMAFMFFTWSMPAQSASPTRAFKDMGGVTHTIPVKIERIADNWPAHNTIILMLGGGDKIVATSQFIKNTPGFQPVFLRLAQLPTPLGSTPGTTNLEELIKVSPEIVIDSPQAGVRFDDSTKDRLKQAGIAVTQLTFDNYSNLKECVRLTAELIGEGMKKAEEYCSYIDRNIAKVNSVISKIPAAQRPKVYHVGYGASPLRTEGRGTIAQTWIETAGGVNVAADMVGGYGGHGKDVSMEQVISWNPDVIIIGSGENGLDMKKEIMADPKWSAVKAIQEKKVFVTPRGILNWDVYCAEEAIMVLWAAKSMYPDQFKDVNMLEETKSFYSQFYGYAMTNEVAEKVLQSAKWWIK
jgi:iron complex transport system substrate-binding protein